LPEGKIDPLHISQAFNLGLEEHDLDFFDANLYYDSPLFIDPFLLKTSPVKTENDLFPRFGEFFQYAYRKSLDAKTDKEYEKLKQFLSFKEPIEINLGYTFGSNKGSGLGGVFASAILTFFLKSSAHRVIMNDELYPDKQFNPDILTVLTDGVGPDGISDLSACLIMDYLVEYTQEQCKALNITLKELPVRQSFDFEEMQWTDGRYYSLPENPVRRGEPVVFVPKRLLRMGLDMSPEKAKSKIIGVLGKDRNLTERFSSLLTKNLGAITTEDIQDAIIQENSIISRYLTAVEKEGINSYDFDEDVLNVLAFKKYADLFSDKQDHSITSCEELLKATHELVQEFNDELARRDGWRDTWHNNEHGTPVPSDEKSFGRKFRGMGFAYFKTFPQVTFIPEAGTGNGLVDFLIIFLDCRITIEVKRLSNASATGNPFMPAYLHGVVRQLPEYTILHKAKNAFYITGQHYKRGKGGIDHSSRVKEITDQVPVSEKAIKDSLPNLEKLFYVNIDLSPRPTASKI
jgi:hypothetical protein